MSEQYPGGYITKSPVLPNGSTAPGMWTLSQQAAYQNAGLWPNVPDAQFNYVTMLLHGNGGNGGQNNTFVDSSTNGFGITRYGNTTQGSFSPYTPTNSSWSNYFDGSSNIVGSLSSALGTGDFTVEFWVYIVANTGTSGEGGFLQTTTSSTGLSTSEYGSTSLTMQRNSVTNKYGFSVGSTSVEFSNAGTYQNQWMHIACVRSSGTVRIYMNGVLNSTPTSATTNLTGTYIGIGGYYNGNYLINAYISNFRVTNTVVYNAAFTPPTTPLTAISGTLFLGCQSIRFLNTNSGAAMTINTGTPSVQRFNPFGTSAAYLTSSIGGSGYFDGSSDYLTAGTNSAYDFGTGDFTIEFWAYVTKSMTTSSVTTAIGYGTSLGSNGWAIDSGLSNGCFTWAWLTSPYTSVTTGVLPQNSWCHVAIVRSGTTLTAYLNGAVSETKTFSSSVTPTNAPLLTIGQHSSIIAGREYQGYLTDVRLLKGVAAYTGAFTPPTKPISSSGAASAASYPSTTNVNTSFASSACSLLLNTTNGAIYDNAMIADLETVGNAQISTTQKKFGTSSIYFDGTGDWLVTPDSVRDLFRFGTGDFTIEFWAWKSANGVNGYDGVIGSDNNGNAPGGFAVELSSNRGFVFYNDSNVRISYAMNPNDSTWHHYACVRSSGTMALYKDGTQLTTATYTGDLGCNVVVRVGTLGTTSNFNGYIDDLRVTRGYARYTTSFTPPTAPFPNTGPV